MIETLRNQAIAQYLIDAHIWEDDNGLFALEWFDANYNKFYEVLTADAVWNAVRDDSILILSIEQL